MERKLPEYSIEGTPFIVDVNKGELRKVTKPDNIISFSNMQYIGSHYTLDYDLFTKGLSFFTKDALNTKVVEVPQMVNLDPEGMAQKYNIPVAALQGKTDFDIIVDQDLLRERLNGNLPVIKIADHDFIVDFPLKELRPKNDFNTSIRLHELHYSIEEEKYKAFYHIPSHCIVDINPATIKEIPENLVQIEIPIERKLDPVGAAREYGFDYKDLLIKYPLESNLEAKVIPIEKTNLPYLVKANNEREKQLQKNKPHKSLRRRKNGIGL